ncbi:MAG: molybdopterin-synthase adenylyltransferase MoeB [Mucilaginibacter sp.]
MLEKDEIKRYQRQIILPELGMEGQQKLKQAKVLMVGAGGLGCPVLQYLVAGGVGTIGIIDNDIVDLSNLHRQILYTVNDIGLNKAIVAKQKLELLNPLVSVEAYPVRLTEDNIHDIFELYDIIIDGSDNFPTRYLVNDACVRLNKPLIFGSIFKFEGQVSVFNYLNGPNYRDLFPEAPASDEVPNCSEIGVIGVLPGMVGTLMANEAIKVISGIGDTLSGSLLCINALNNSINVFGFCGAEGTSLHVKQSKAPQENTSVIKEIDILTLNSWVDDNPDEICLVDVREAYEFEDFNIGGINIPLFELLQRTEEIPKDKKKVVFYCLTGQRSKQAVHLSRSFLTAETYSLKDGINTLSH